MISALEALCPTIGELAANAPECGRLGRNASDSEPVTCPHHNISLVQINGACSGLKCPICVYLSIQQSFAMDDWRTMATAPKNATSVRVKMKDGTVHEDAHWAQGGGEDQPPFIGWFIPVKNEAGETTWFCGIDDPAYWQPRLAISPEKIGGG